jgi:hypothetical protein
MTKAGKEGPRASDAPAMPRSSLSRLTRFSHTFGGAKLTLELCITASGTMGAIWKSRSVDMVAGCGGDKPGGLCLVRDGRLAWTRWMDGLTSCGAAQLQWVRVKLAI